MDKKLREMYYPTKEIFKEKAKEGNLIPIYREILADLETPVSAFKKISAEGEYACLLESVEEEENVGRYSFLASNPSLIFQSKKDVAEIIKGGKSKKFKLKGDPLAFLQEIMNNYKIVKEESLPPFYGGLVGYLGYDLIHFFEEIPDKNEDELDLPDCLFMLSDTILIFDHVQHKIKIVANAYIEKGNIDQAYKEAVENIERIIKKIARAGESKFLAPNAHLSPKIKSNFSQEKFKESVEKAQEYIKAGDILQVVLSQRLKMKIKGDPFNIYRVLRTINPSPYMYYLKFGDLKLIGSSPEILVKVKDGIVEERPIAGTRPRGKDEKEDKRFMQELLADPKEKAEHIMLVDLGRNDLGRVCEYGSVKVTDLMNIEKYSHVMHIVSDIKGRLRKDKSIFDVLRACFPAGTVSGAPKVRAMEIIDELEPIRRGPYAGAIGYFSFSGNLDSCITIRTIIIKGDIAYIQAGAGIVADSEPEKEYAETMNKAKALLKAIEGRT